MHYRNPVSTKLYLGKLLQEYKVSYRDTEWCFLFHQVMVPFFHLLQNISFCLTTLLGVVCLILGLMFG